MNPFEFPIPSAYFLTTPFPLATSLRTRTSALLFAPGARPSPVAAAQILAARSLAVAIALLVSPSLHAHKSSDSYLTVERHDSALEIQWAVALRDLEVAVGLDDNNDSAITWGELRQKSAAIEDYFQKHFAIQSDRRVCRVAGFDLLADNYSDGAYAVLRCRSQIKPGAPFMITYRAFFDIDPSHRGLLRLSSGKSQISALFDPSHDQQEFDTTNHSISIVAFVREGIWHIWTGYDHVLFLLALLFPAVFIRAGRQWQTVLSFRPAAQRVVQTVTAFTVAHSSTLTLATLGFVHLPSRWIESAIAASVLLAAANNLWPLLPVREWVMAFAFGLVHGFGFAAVLGDLGLTGASLALSLVSFNAGVELGQLAIVIVILPLIFHFRQAKFYHGFTFRWGSVSIASLAMVWMAERMFDFKWLPF